jgi:hypothetical protein
MQKMTFSSVLFVVVLFLVWTSAHDSSSSSSSSSFLIKEKCDASDKCWERTHECAIPTCWNYVGQSLYNCGFKNVPTGTYCWNQSSHIISEILAEAF